MANNATRVVVKRTPITLDSIKTEGEFLKKDKDGKVVAWEAQIRLKVITDSYYPAKKVSNELSGGLFSASDFGFEEQMFTSEEDRVTWLQIPLGTTDAQINAMLPIAQEKNKATIYRILSNAPILTDDQKSAIDRDLRTYDEFADSQVMKYPENEETLLDGTAGQYIMDESDPKRPKVQYRVVYFWNDNVNHEFKEDIDLRGKVEEYRSPAMKAALESASAFEAAQTIS